MSKKRIKLLTMSDHPLLPSGVATQTKYMIEALLQSDRFEVISLGGAVKHNDYTPLAVDGYDGRWNIFPLMVMATKQYFAVFCTITSLI